MRRFALILILATSKLVYAQGITNIETLLPEKDYENVSIKKLFSDSNSSTFIIWIKKQVKSHKHTLHTESIIVIEGNGEMTIGEKTFPITKGDYFVIPKNTYHALKVTSKEAIKVLSTQTPKFLGADRVYEMRE